MSAKGQGRLFVASDVIYLRRYGSSCVPDFWSLVSTFSSDKILQNKNKSGRTSDIYLGNERNSRLIGLKQLHGRTQLL